MDRKVASDIRCLHAYLALLLGSSEAAARVLGGYLNRLIAEPGPAPVLGDMMAAVHCSLAAEGPWVFPGDGLSERQRALNWRLRGLELEDRAVLLLGSIARSEHFDAARILGLTRGGFETRRAAALDRMRSETALVLSRHAIVALDLRSIVSALGVMNVRIAPGLADLPRLLDQYRPAVVVADSSGVSSSRLADCLDVQAAGLRVPAVVISAALQRSDAFPIHLRKPFSPAALRSAVLAAIGA